MPLCAEPILPPGRAHGEFALPPIEGATVIAAAMQAVTSALAGGRLTHGEAATIALEFTSLIST
jgi:hypothetical protein